MQKITQEVIDSFNCANAMVAIYVDHWYVSYAEAAEKLANNLAKDYRYYSLVPAFTTALELRGKNVRTFADRMEAAYFIAEAWVGNYIEMGQLPSEDINVFGAEQD